MQSDLGASGTVPGDGQLNGLHFFQNCESPPVTSLPRGYKTLRSLDRMEVEEQKPAARSPRCRSGASPHESPAVCPRPFPEQEKCTGAGVLPQRHSRPHPSIGTPSVPLCRFIRKPRKGSANVFLEPLPHTTWPETLAPATCCEQGSLEGASGVRSRRASCILCPSRDFRGIVRNPVGKPQTLGASRTLWERRGDAAPDPRRQFWNKCSYREDVWGSKTTHEMPTLNRERPLCCHG